MISLLVIGHFVGDFLCQTRRVFAGKNTSLAILIEHCAIYTAVLALFALIAGCLSITFCALCFSSHVLVDYKMGSEMEKSLKSYDYPMFFGLMGFDQIAHILVLVNISDLTFLDFAV